MREEEEVDSTAAAASFYRRNRNEDCRPHSDQQQQQWSASAHIRREDAASTACLSALESVLSASGAQPGSAQALSLLREIAFSLDSALEAQVPPARCDMTSSEGE